jgi:hypothetical protein
MTVVVDREQLQTIALVVVQSDETTASVVARTSSVEARATIVAGNLVTVLSPLRGQT